MNDSAPRKVYVAPAVETLNVLETHGISGGGSGSGGITIGGGGVSGGGSGSISITFGGFGS